MNAAGPSGLCSRHQRKREGPTEPTKPAGESPELVLARKVITAARAWFRDPDMKGRFVAALGDYDDLVSQQNAGGK